MTIADKLAALPEMPRYEDYGDSGQMFKREFDLKTSPALRARLSLALGVLANSPCSCFYEFRESGKDWLNVCDRCATLEAMKELR